MIENNQKDGEIRKPINLLEYLRVSTYKQKKDVTIKTQKLENNKFKENNRNLYNVINTYMDEGKSGFKFEKEERPDFYKMLNELYSNDSIEGILVYDIDRIGRDSLELMELGEDFVKKNKVIVSVTHGGIVEQDSPEGKLIYGIFALLSEFKGTTDKRRMQTGRDRKKQENIAKGLPKTFGFGRKKKIVPKEIKDKMIKWYKKGYGFKIIQNKMIHIPYQFYNEKKEKYETKTGFKLSTVTIGERLKEWNIPIREPKYHKSNELIKKVLEKEVNKRVESLKKDLLNNLNKLNKGIE